ncbi:nuclear transport factor 2 family protein [Microbacterium oleivorans]|uniref:SnoaL-like domain-containing protein n=1 Tax=Microbacterium oleivorans TaxID=273677 RepID=A0A177K8N8_9MICO|nr:nuclear transport factor 2 family protein [Microbacterium oleivorans]OAH49406.1 hypothetical protein AYL44_11130 [Microbacterium oleivorans]
MMQAVSLLSQLMSALDEHRWDELERYLHPAFSCRYVHTEESFDRAAWIELNAAYPGFEGLRVEEVLGDQTRAACRSVVTARDDSGVMEFACATFISVRDGLIETMTEVWTEVSQAPPPGTRPS